ncbi:hypothetical protein, variant [Cryptococcus amylolentus CBS 6039]|uniref:Major facilitator superfamily (MFS) profile domain-containing protein n=2 Tax=Cryptococcus amylolentus TaxID=104669 RepID=A0A1E3I8K1_9TREE|nr:hypothetical protein L202_00786 [Cryptococcus amylolentus CBS 6039]XP_018998744.1 hypothetical protein, variant [Cryptococcus amylolentus CBS 6039]ODN84940.1 hypothetical protein L202_00786 [Cryptococcus amylolentus CBS 6039]ODN84941.1 hypothetical protein, variant [Cryptococcus amylolentus CBS 6039]
MTSPGQLSSPMDEKKPEIDHVEHKAEPVEHVEDLKKPVDTTVDSAVSHEIEVLRSMSDEELAAEEKKLVRKIDIALMPTLFVLLILNYLDRNALSSARVQGIEKSLGMVGNQFNTAISLLFVGYILGQIPSNMILSKTRPSIYLGTCVMIWSLVSLSTGFVKNYHQLLAVRILLGFTESPYFPGALFLLSTWYTKQELAFRTAFLYCGSLLAGAFSGLIAAGVENGLDGAKGMESWRWLFIVDGSVSGFFAIVSIFILPDYPATTRWLSTREKAIAVWRMERDGGQRDEDDEGMFKGLMMALTDYRLYLLAIIIITKTTAAAVTQFIPTVIQTFKFNKVITLLLSAPPYLVASVISLLVSRLSDRRPERCWHIAIPVAVGMIGNIIAVSSLNTGARYFSIFLMLGGLYGCYTVSLSWISTTFPRPRTKRASAYAVINALGNIAQVYSPYLYPSTDSPRYTTAFATNSAITALAVVFCFVLRAILKRDNKRMDREEMEAEERGLEVEGRARYVL